MQKVILRKLEKNNFHGRNFIFPEKAQDSEKLTLFSDTYPAFRPNKGVLQGRLRCFDRGHR